MRFVPPLLLVRVQSSDARRIRKAIISPKRAFSSEEFQGRSGGLRTRGIVARELDDRNAVLSKREEGVDHNFRE